MVSRKERRNTYNKILSRETKIALDRYGPNYYRRNVKKSAAFQYKKQRKKRK